MRCSSSAQPVEQRAADLRLAGELHVALVGEQDLLLVLLERGGDRLERRVLDGGVGLREPARGALGRAADVCDAAGDGGHGRKGRDPARGAQSSTR